MQAVKLAKETGTLQASRELGVPKGTLYGWIRAAACGELNMGAGSQTPQEAMTLSEEIKRLPAENKAQEKQIRRLKEENAFLEEASAFFAASRQMSASRKE